MSIPDEEDEFLAQFIESEVLSEVSDKEEGNREEEPKPKRARIEQINPNEQREVASVTTSFSQSQSKGVVPGRIETGIFSKVPLELFRHILKFLSSEDLVSCSLVCRFLNSVASDESLWRRLYCLRWGLMPATKKLRQCPWKKLYIQRDGEDMTQLVRDCSSEFKEYYIQMQAAKRSQAPLPSQVQDDQIILDRTVADQVSSWKSSKGLADKIVIDHTCSGETCTYYQIGDAFVCEKTGLVHVCDDTCREVIMDPDDEQLVCRISGHCFDNLLLPDSMEPDSEQQLAGVTDEAEAEPFMGSGRFARAYLLGYNCADEAELEATLRFC
ncbi:F-box protein SKIP31-like [Cucurbita maxima]|uniref:F-box protein SKIP31-like n=1 Tax=Cucurbita maxima TaxID=3661 RepID=A0A6J1ISU8_CUCMA|nr:F-box protein SKIP31-like [Cucurbita maxima]